MILEMSLNDDSFVAHFMGKPEPFLKAMPEEDCTKLKAHAAWYFEGNHGTISIMTATTTRFAFGVRMLTRMLRLLSTCVEGAGMDSARFTAHRNGCCVVNTFHRL